MSKRKGDDDDEEPMRSQLSRLDLSGVKRKPDDGDTERKQSRKAIRQVESPYEAMRRDLILANPAAALEVRSLLDAKQHSFLDHVIIMINMRDEGGLMKILDQEKLEPATAASVFRAVVRNNLLPVIVKVITLYPQVDIEEAVQDGIRYPSCRVPTMKLLLTLWADEHGETVEAAAKQMLDKAGKDSVILDPARLRALREMAGMPDRGLDEEEPKQPVAREREEAKEIQLAPVTVEEIPPTFFEGVRGNNVLSSGTVFTPDGKYVLYSAQYIGWGAPEGRIRVVDVEAQKIARYLPDVLPVQCLAVAQDSKTVYAASHDRIRVIDFDTGNVVRTINEPRIEHRLHSGIQSIALSPDGKFVAIGDSRGHVFIVDLSTGLSARTLDPPHPETAKLCYSFDGTVLFWRSVVDRAAMWDTQTGQRYAGSPLSDALDFAVSPVEPLLAILSSRESTLTLWDYSTRKVIRSFRFPPAIASVVNVSFSPHGTKLVLSGSQYFVIDIAANAIIYASKAHGGADDSLTVSPVDYRLVAGASPFLGKVVFYDFRGGKGVKALRESVADGLANWGQPQSAWDVFLSRGLYDPRLLLHIMAFTAKF